jgi:flagellar M-ring protein FliF
MPPFVQSMFGRVGGGRQAAIIAVGVIVTALVFGVSRWATAPTMVPLFADVPIESVGKMTDKLTESAIAFELDRTGSTILVGSADLAKARVALARDAMPMTGRPGLELFDKPSWGMTDFTQKVNYRRALEGELERTIGKMRDIKAVQVHLALEDDQVFKKNERPSKASVTLTMTDGGRPNEGTVRGIASLVAGSVGGLEPDHVTIVDERGEALTMDGDGSVAGLSSRQLAVQREVESYMEQKVAGLLTSLVGSGNSRVQVAAAINFDKIERTTQAVDPDKQATSTEQRAEVTPGTPQQGAGYSTTATSYENTRSVESFSGAIGNLKRLTVAVLVADKVTMPPATANATTPAVPIVVARNPEEIARIETLVRNALGVDSARGDLISVVSAPFDMPAVAIVDSLPVPDLIARLQANPKPIVAIAALVVLLLVAIVALIALKPKKTPLTVAATLPPAAGYPELPASSAMQQALQASRTPVTQAELEALAEQAEERRAVILPPLPTSTEREQAMATIDQRPEAALRVVRGWLRS